MPLIRYEIGDYAEVGQPCPCGRGLPVLNRILGRQRNMLHLPDGRRRWPSLDHVEGDHDVGLLPIGQLQVVQKTREEIEVNLVAARSLSTVEESILMKHLARALGDSFRIDLHYVTHIPRSPSGKFEDFRSEIPHEPDRSDGAPVEQTVE
jgi:phenylacetate-CoA ligase